MYECVQSLLQITSETHIYFNVELCMSVLLKWRVIKHMKYLSEHTCRKEEKYEKELHGYVMK